MGTVCFLLIALMLVGIFIGIIAYFADLAVKRRRQELAALAQSLGWLFDPSEDRSHDERYKQFAVFQKGDTRFAFNLIAGVMTIDGRDYPVRMGDYHYRVKKRNGKKTSTTTYQFSYLIVGLPFLGAQELFIRREGFLDKLAGFIGFDDIDFESAEFSRRFHVKSSDKRFAYDILHPRMMKFLLTSNPPTIDLEGQCCCLCDGTRRWEPDEFRATLGWANAFFDRWPDHITTTRDR